ncbi:protein component of RNase P [Oleiphilus messinensis]|uniref:Ribonuclease P protein component n=1 Tax=Oleiphilus messinensis TaxID=141451 RepID=A0A1Y0IGI0_9GAMM|nr:ribonuclease P protein component [Oleiphilus messinensis]ARU59611.1 protein component of RNase P [Oleiphilus messinensis]
MTSYEFPRQSRLLNAEDFRRVFDNVQIKAGNQHFLLLTVSNSLDHPRIGFVFSKKNIKLAVRRNKLKRLFRESFRLNCSRLPAVDIVILARKGVNDVDLTTFNKESDRLWKKLIKRHQEHAN